MIGQSLGRNGMYLIAFRKSAVAKQTVEIAEPTYPHELSPVNPPPEVTLLETDAVQKIAVMRERMIENAKRKQAFKAGR